MRRGVFGALGIIAALGLATAGCGGGGSSGGGGSASATATGGATGTGTGSGATNDTQAPTFAAAQGSGSGAFMTSQGGVVTISGTADDNVGVTSVTVNGQAAAITGSGTQVSWQAQVTAASEGVLVVEVEVADAAGNTAEGFWAVYCADQFVASTDALPGAFVAEITDSGLVHVGSIVSGLLQQNNALAQALLNQVAGGALASFLGSSGGVGSITFDPPTVAFDATAAGLATSIDISNLAIGSLAVPTAHLDATVAVTVSGGQYQVSTSNVDAQVTMTGASAALAPIVELAIEAAITTALPPALVTALNSINPSFTAPTPIPNLTVTAGIEPEAVTYSNDAIRVVLAANLTTSHTGSRNAPGSPAGSVANAAFTGTHDAGLAVSASIFNRVAYAAWEANLLDLTVDQSALSQFGLSLPFQLNAGLLGLFLPTFQSFNPSDPIAIHLGFIVPPSVGTNALTPNMHGAVFADASIGVDSGAGFVTVLGVNVALELSVDAQVTPQAITFAFAQPTTVHAGVTQNGMNLPIGNINTLVNGLLSQAITFVSNALPAIPVPTISQIPFLSNLLPNTLPVQVDTLGASFNDGGVQLEATFK